MEKLKTIRDIHNMSRGDMETICQEYVDHAYIGDHLQLCRVLSKYKMYVDGRDMGIAPHLIMEGFWESWITKFIAGVVKPGAVCLDIGANFGYYSLVLAELAGDSGRTIAIEPNPELCDLLRANAAVNHWHFEVVDGAAADKKGETTLTVFDKYFGGATIMPLDDSQPGRRHFTVQTFTIDELLEQKGIDKLDFIKMDCEGFEPFVMNGMERTLRQNPDINIVMEYSAYMYADPETFTKKLFSEFNVFHITSMSTLHKLSTQDIAMLVQQKAPYDMFLTPKRNTSFFAWTETDKTF